MKQPVTIALPKGRLLEESLSILGNAGFSLPTATSRKLIIDSTNGEVHYILAKPWDVPTYVEHGAADLGIVGLDVLRERHLDVYEPLLLPVGYCRLVVAGPPTFSPASLRLQSVLRVATKFPNLTTAFFRREGISAEIIGLSGSVELGPLVGLSDLIVDLVQTGATLRENGLVELQTILASQGVLIANRASFRLHKTLVHEMIAALSDVILSKSAAQEVPTGAHNVA